MNLSIKNNYINRILERKKLLLWSIFALGLLLRIAFIILWDRRPNFDTQNYIAQAEGILNGNPVSIYPNGYPLIIAAVILLTGKNLIFPVMISLNLIAQFFTGYFLYKITKAISIDSICINLRSSATISEKQIRDRQQEINPRPLVRNINALTIIVLFIFAIYPTQILYTNSVLTEAITTLFITTSVYGILCNAYFFGGFSLAIASMIRTSFLPALILTFLYILYTNISKKPRPSSSKKYFQLYTLNLSLNNHRQSAKICENLRENLSASICENLREPKTKHYSPVLKYVAGIALVLSFFTLLDFTGITKFPENQNYNLLVAINGRSSSINHNLNNFSESDFASPLQTYINFARNNPKEFILQRADAFWRLWGILPFETHHLYSKLLFSIRTFLFLSWIYWLYILIRKKDISKQSLFNNFIIYLSILIITITIIHTLYFSSFRFIVPIEPVLLILLVFTIFRFSIVNQSIIQSFNQPITNNQQLTTNN